MKRATIYQLVIFRGNSCSSRVSSAELAYQLNAMPSAGFCASFALILYSAVTQPLYLPMSFTLYSAHAYTNIHDMIYFIILHA